jgi:hypothetical protein
VANALILNGLEGEERRRMEIAIGNASGVFKRLQQLIEKELEKESVPSFSSPNWAEETAYMLGYQKGLTRALKYVIITDK